MKPSPSPTQIYRLRSPYLHFKFVPKISIVNANMVRSTVRKVNEEMMPHYYKAKLASDETITVLGEEKKGFGYIVLRPGNLSDDPESGRVVMGKTPARGQVTRGDVAEVAARLL